MLLRHSIREFVWLLAAMLGVACHASAATAPRRPFDGLRKDLHATWSVADLNGDNRPDLITASSTRNLSGGYTHRVRIGLAGQESGTLSFASAHYRIRVSARDVDGDHDPDLVVFGPISPRPIFVWLNDGAGHFHRGDASQLPAESESVSLEGAAHDDDTVVGLSDEQSSLVVPEIASVSQNDAVGRAATAQSPVVPAAVRANVRPRAPPR